MKNVSFLIKPASSLCNMRCRYCFYEDEAEIREKANVGIMTDKTADLLIRQSIAQTEQGGSLSFAFQGGEPTVAGLDYFENFVSAVRRYNTKPVTVGYALQTNGLNLTAEWADFFVRERFLIGISLDGTRAIHDSLRPDGGGKGTWDRIQKNLIMMQKKGVEMNILCVVTKRCAKNPEKVYRSLKDTGIRYLQFIPCLDPFGAERGKMPWSLTPGDYAHFLCGLFDAWYRDWLEGHYVSVRLFDDYVHLAMGMPSGTCSTSGTCGGYCVVEGDGTLYPCDFYCLDEWRLGKLGEEELGQMMDSDMERLFLEEGRRHPKECSQCRWERLCFGGCKRDWIFDGKENHNYFCSAFRQFFSYAAERILQIAAKEMRVQRLYNRR